MKCESTHFGRSFNKNWNHKIIEQISSQTLHCSHVVADRIYLWSSGLSVKDLKGLSERLLCGTFLCVKQLVSKETCVQRGQVPGGREGWRDLG